MDKQSTPETYQSVHSLGRNGSIRQVKKEPLLKNISRKKNKRDEDKTTTWEDFWKKCKLLAPYLWHKGRPLLQLNVLACFLLLGAVRAVNVLIPIMYKKIVDSLSPVPAYVGTDNPATPTNNGFDPDITVFRWDYILLYVLLKSLRGTGGYLTAVRNVLWISVSQHAKKTLRIQLFEHLHSLSVRWHIEKKTGEVLRVMDKGVESVDQILNLVLTHVLPIIVDIFIAITFFFTAFDVYIGLVVTATMVLYCGVTVWMSEWRTKFRRNMNKTANQQQGTAVDSLLNFETVKLYAAEKWEVNRFSEAVCEFQHAEWWVQASANILASLQVTFMSLGLLAGSLISAYYVSVGKFSAGDYVLYTSYLTQLYEPLDMLASYYRRLQTCFVDMEHMFDLFSKKPEIEDEPGARPLVIREGRIEFKNINFSYQPDKPCLKNISFSVPPGKTYALVGPSGGGKSSLVKLLFRLYDVQSGSITIDGQNIAKVTHTSLRQQLGIVPQDTALFNTDIRYNIEYGEIECSEEEVEDAAKAAHIHHTISKMPNGYDTKIGERGLRLSGGERQRIAIARMILKSPKILLLDEATSSLDSKTERIIQMSLARLCEGRTTLMVAHRLSTVMHADQILVINEGSIAERGRHHELLSYGGLYAEMWYGQQYDNQASTVESSKDTGINKRDSKDITKTSLSMSFSNLLCSTPRSETSPPNIWTKPSDKPVKQHTNNETDSNPGSVWTLPRPVLHNLPWKPNPDTSVSRWRSCNAVFLRHQNSTSSQDDPPVWPRRGISVQEDPLYKSRELIDTYLVDYEDRGPARQVEHSLSLCDAYGMQWRPRRPSRITQSEIKDTAASTQPRDVLITVEDLEQACINDTARNKGNSKYGQAVSVETL